MGMIDQVNKDNQAKSNNTNKQSRCIVSGKKRVF